MSRLDDTGVDRADRDLVHALAVNRQELVFGRMADRGRRARAERRVNPPGAVVEPVAPVGRAERLEAVQVADGALQPQCRHVLAADRGKIAVGRRDRDDDRGFQPAGAQAEMDLSGLRPQGHQIASAVP
jgi:hypothetical protein